MDEITVVLLTSIGIVVAVILLAETAPVRNLFILVIPIAVVAVATAAVIGRLKKSAPTDG